VECCLQIVQKGDVRVIRIAGCLSSAHVPDLLRACGEATGRVRVDLSDVLSIDPIALDALRRVKQAGAELVGVPQYMKFKLDSGVKSGR
jgi:anti-anti-sigma regulatory factor